MRASAPGKILLLGEYAVLDGSPAIVVAVDRFAVARLVDQPQELSPFLAAVREEMGPAVDRVVVDTRGFAEGGKKLGLGSSAAATVAAVALVAGDDRERIHAVAHRAHARAQEPRGARGSGADIAASVHGGLLQVQGRPEDGPLAVRRLVWPAGVELVVLWTGTPADTPSLVAAVRALRDRDATAHGAALDAIAAAAVAFPADPIAAVADGARALAALGEAAGVPLVPRGFDAIAALADRYGGAAKPTGAGGGDLVAALLPGESAAAFRADATSKGMTLVTTSVTQQGVTLAEAGDPD